eukprot:4504743-Amphidinium_carterae.1
MASGKHSGFALCSRPTGTALDQGEAVSQGCIATSVFFASLHSGESLSLKLLQAGPVDIANGNASKGWHRSF